MSYIFRPAQCCAVASHCYMQFWLIDNSCTLLHSPANANAFPQIIFKDINSGTYFLHNLHRLLALMWKCHQLGDYKHKLEPFWLNDGFHLLDQVLWLWKDNLKKWVHLIIVFIFYTTLLPLAFLDILEETTELLQASQKERSRFLSVMKNIQ